MSRRLLRSGDQLDPRQAFELVKTHQVPYIPGDTDVPMPVVSPAATTPGSPGLHLPAGARRASGRGRRGIMVSTARGGGASLQRINGWKRFADPDLRATR